MNQPPSFQHHAPDRPSVTIVGAGPAGLAAGHEAVRQGFSPVILEKSSQVGGISRTETYKGYHFDIGGHRFFTKMEPIDALWNDMLGDQFLTVPRMSRIFYNDRFFNYPLNMSNTLSNMGLVESVRIGMSYIQAQLLPHAAEETFAQWVSNRFGKRLYEIFFKSYTEKVWGIPCDDIMAEWAVQRIQDLSLMKALVNAIFKNQTAKSLIEEFRYPLLGPGMMWDRFAAAIVAGGGDVRLDREVVRLDLENHRIRRILSRTLNTEAEEHRTDQVVSSIPITSLIKRLHPAPPPAVLRAADSLSYRAFIIVMLIIDRRDLFPDQWIYVHSPRVKVARIQNFKNWSPGMVPDADRTSIGMEYFCNVGDDVWVMPDDHLTRLATEELKALGLGHASAVRDSHVVRQPFAYPVYDKDYARHLATIRGFLGTIDNLQTIGRSGMHRYNNMDHAMMTGILAVKNILGERHDLWQVNDDGEYLEEVRIGESLPDAQEMVHKTFARLDKSAFALAAGLVAGMGVFLATLWLVIKGGPVVGPNLRLLDQYFFNYTVSFTGAFWGMANGFLWGFAVGGMFAWIRNVVTACYVFWIRKKYELSSLRDFFDHI